MKRTVAVKMGIRENSRAIFISPPPDAIENMELPALDTSTRLQGKFDYIHLFCTTQKEFNKRFSKLKSHLAVGGMLWVSWPKGGKLDTDLNIKIVIKLGYGFGLVESTALSINPIWSGLKFTHPKKGKVYSNSYGQLKI